MNLFRDMQLFSYASCIATLSIVLLMSYGLANANPREIIIHTQRSDCPPVLSERFEEALRLRTTTKIISRQTPDEDDRWVLVFQTRDDTTCEIRLDGPETSDSFLLRHDADALQLSSIATRLAFVIDILDASDHIVEKPPQSDTPEIAEESPQPPSEVPLETESLPVLASGSDATSDMQLWSIDASGGFMWLPSASSNVGLATLSLGWQLRPQWQLRADFRIPLSKIEARRNDTSYTYTPWAFGFGGRYQRDFTNGWTLHLGTGLRFTSAQLIITSPTTNSPAENLPEESGRPETLPTNAGPFGNELPARNQREETTSLSEEKSYVHNGALFTSATITKTLVGALAIRAETTIAATLNNREIQVGQDFVFRPGWSKIGVLLGLELRF